jgi:methionyl-tRNA formyltransferase
MKKILFLVNSLVEFNFNNLIKKYLKGVRVMADVVMPKYTDRYDLIILWGYRKIIPNISEKINIIIFHSSDLPKGRGWAPIYYSLSKKLRYYVISGILPAETADTGNIIVKAKFKIKDNYTAEIIREWDTEISIILIKKILKRFKRNELKGIKQKGKGSYHPRRKPQDNEISLHSRLAEVVDRLRACEKLHPAFFYYGKTKYYL